MSKNECDLCFDKIVEQYDKDHFYNKILYQKDDFFIVSAIGPITVGHVMIIPKLHIPSIAYLDSKKIEQLVELIDFLKKYYSSISGNVIVFENASSYEDLGSSCVQHAHINFLPYDSNIHNSALNMLFEQPILSNSIKRLPVDKTYIYWSNSSSESVYDSQGIYPQFIRKQLLANIGNNEWDWTIHKNEDVIKQTINVWQEMIGEENVRSR